MGRAAPFNAGIMASNPYPKIKDTQPRVTICEVCARDIMTKDWAAHKNSKKHRLLVKELEAKENGKPTDTGGFDTGAAADAKGGWDDSYVGTTSGGKKSGGGSGTCYSCGQTGHLKRDCPSGGLRGACFGCGEVGHNKADCPNPSRQGVGGAGRACYGCGEEGHTKANCPTSRQGGSRTCYNCGEEGHTKADCTSSRQETAGGGSGSGGGQCFNCYEYGHRKLECPNERVMKCRNCDAIGHEGKDCDQPKDWSRVKCNNCNEFGHTKHRCPKPVQESGRWSDDAAGGGGWNETAEGGPVQEVDWATTTDSNADWADASNIDGGEEQWANTTEQNVAW